MPHLQAGRAPVESRDRVSGTHRVEVDLLVAKAARSIARQHGLKPVDAIHLATAVRAGADQLLTWDPHFPDGAVLEGVTCVRPHLVGLPQPLEGFPGDE